MLMMTNGVLKYLPTHRQSTMFSPMAGMGEMANMTAFTTRSAAIALIVQNNVVLLGK